MLIQKIGIILLVLLMALPICSYSIEPEEPTVIPVDYYLEGMTVELTEYLIEVCEEFDVKPILMYKLMKHESGLDSNNVSKNYRKQRVVSKDRGLCQINSKYEDWYAELAGLDEFDVFDPKDSIRMGTAGIANYKKYWKNRGKTGKTLIDYALSSYNRGVGGTHKKLGKAYINMVRKQKVKFIEKDE